MPIFTTTTKASREIWRSPDGTRTIYEVTLDYEGKPVLGKTYSNDIATVGWSGNAETYEKQGKRGIETFVRQAPKENTGYSSGSTKGNYTPKDEKAIQAMWAIGQAVQLNIPRIADGKLADVGEALQEIYGAAIELMSMVDAVKESGTSNTKQDTVYEPVDDEPNAVDDGQQSLMQDIEEVFDKVEEVKWKKGT